MYECISCSVKFRADVTALHPVTADCGHDACKACVDAVCEKGDIFLDCQKCEREVDVAEMSDDWDNMKPIPHGVNHAFKDILEKESLIVDGILFLLPKCSICKDFLESNDQNPPKTRKICGHTFCEKCLQRNMCEAPHKNICVDCKKETPFVLEKSTVISKAILEFLKGKEMAFPLCFIHRYRCYTPEPSPKFLVCTVRDSQFEKHFVQEPSCEPEAICIVCTRDGKHRGHSFAHFLVEVRDLREKAEKIAKDDEALVEKYTNEIRDLERVKASFNPDWLVHLDHQRLKTSIDNFYDLNPELAGRKEEMERVEYICVQFTHTLDRYLGISRERLRELKKEKRDYWRSKSDTELVAARKEIEKYTECSNVHNQKPFPSSFEHFKLSTFYVDRTKYLISHDTSDIMLAQYIDVTVNLRNKGAEEVYGHFCAWILAENNHVLDANIVGKTAYFTFDIRKYRVTKSSLPEPEQPGPCQFIVTNAYNQKKTVSAFMEGDDLSIDLKLFSNWGTGFTHLLHLLKIKPHSKFVLK